MARRVRKVCRSAGRSNTHHRLPAPLHPAAASRSELAAIAHLAKPARRRWLLGVWLARHSSRLPLPPFDTTKCRMDPAWERYVALPSLEAAAASLLGNAVSRPLSQRVPFIACNPH